MFGAGILGAELLGAGETSSSGPVESITIASPSNGASVSENTSITVSGTTTSAGDVEVNVDSGGWVTLATPSGGNYSGSIGTLAAGAHTIEVRQSDNTGVTDSVSITTVADSITITSPTQWQFFRKSGATGTISIDVEYVGSPTNIEYRFSKTGAEAWSSTAATGSPQTLTIAGQASGHGDVQVRFSNDVSVTDSVTDIGVGITIAVAGESNSSGRGSTNNTAPASNAFLYDVTGSWRQLADPYDSVFGGTETYSVLNDASALGSALPPLAQHFVDSGETVAIIPCAKGGTRISAWQRNLATTSLYGAMKARIDAAGGADYLIMWIGANDAIAGETEANFSTDMAQFVVDVQSDLASVPVVIPKLHYASGSYSNSQADLIRSAQDTVIAGTAGAVFGGDLNGLTSSLHFSSAELVVVADTIYSAMFPVVIVTPTTGSITYSGQTPSVSTPITLSPISGNISYSGNIPLIFGNSVIIDQTKGLIDVINEKLKILGYTGTLDNMLISYFKDGGAVSNNFNDAFKEWLIAETGSFNQTNDTWFKYLGDLGYTGTLQQRELQYWANV